VTLRFRARAHALTITVRPVNNIVVAREPYDAPRQSGFPSTIALRAAGPGHPDDHGDPEHAHRLWLRC
jgi:hypothetical protein